MCHQHYALWDGDPYIDVLPLQSSSLYNQKMAMRVCSTYSVVTTGLFPRENVTRRHPIYMLMLRIALHIAL